MIKNISILQVSLLQHDYGIPFENKVLEISFEFCMPLLWFNPKRSRIDWLIDYSQSNSGRNWISAPRCCFSHGIILNRSMWKSRASGGGLSLLYRLISGLLRSHTLMVPKLTTPTWRWKQEKCLCDANCTVGNKAFYTSTPAIATQTTRCVNNTCLSLSALIWICMKTTLNQLWKSIMPKAVKSE